MYVAATLQPIQEYVLLQVFDNGIITVGCGNMLGIQPARAQYRHETSASA
jgi:hypothetical protein